MKKKFGNFIVFAIIMSFFSFSGCKLPSGGQELQELGDSDHDTIQGSLDLDTINKLSKRVDDNQGEEVVLNLANDDEYQFVLARLGMGRKTKANSPWLFNALARTRKKHMATKGRAEITEDTSQGNKHTVVKIDLNDQERLTASAVGSALEGTSYIYLDCVALDEYGKHLTTYQFEESFAAEKVSVSSEGNVSDQVVKSKDGRLPSLVIEYLKADTLMIYQDNEGDLVVSYFYSGTESGILYPVGMKIQAPREQAAIADDDNIVKICLRRNYEDCDYDVLTANEDRDKKHMLMPFKGYADFGLPIIRDEITGRVSSTAIDVMDKPIRNLDLSLCLSSLGGMVTKRKTADEDFFWNHPNTKITTGYDRKGNPVLDSRLEWDITPSAGNPGEGVDFGQTAFAHCETVDFFVQITVPLRETEYFQEERALPGQAFIVPEGHFDDTPYFYKPVISDMRVTEGSHYVMAVGKIDDDDSAAGGVWQDPYYATGFEWQVDTTPPAAAVLYNLPGKTTQMKKFEISVDGADIESYSYQLDLRSGGQIVTGSKSNPIDKGVPIVKDLSNLAFDSVHYVLSVWGIDKAGNEQAVATTYEWVIEPNNSDVIEAVLVNAPPFYCDTNSFEVAVAGEDIAYYRYKLDNQELTSVLETSPGADGDRISAEGLADGFHELAVYGSKNGVDWQIEPTIINWCVDTIPPVVEYNVAISDDHLTPATDFVMEVLGDGIVSYEYSLDRGAAIEQDVRTLIHVGGLNFGQHSLTIRGKDRAGNWQPQSQATRYSWGIDPAANRIVLRNVPRSVTNTTQLNIKLQNDNMASFKYSFDSILLGDELPLKDFMKMPKIQFKYSCLSRNTMITMSDGSIKMIPEIEKGDMVATYTLNDSGTLHRSATPVHDLVRGIETVPMYKIIDVKGESIMATEGHPFMLTDGTLKLAGDINPGDRIKTETGDAKVAVVATETYEDTVYNLVLGEYANRSEWINNGFIMVGNGYLIGDNTTQVIQQNLAARKSKNVLARLPEEMYIDYFFSVIRKLL